MEPLLLLFQILMTGLLSAGVYALAASGLNIIWGVMRIINIAHGELIMLGAFATYWLFTIYSIDPFLSLVIVIPLFFLFGMFIQKSCISRVLETSPVVVLLVAYGISVFLQNLSIVLWTADWKTVYPRYELASVNIAGVDFPFLRLLAFAAGVIMVSILYILVMKTHFGRAIRATQQDNETAMLMGVDVKRIYSITFGIASALGAAAGSIISTLTFFNPLLGAGYLGRVFAVCVLGGLGSFLGTFAGALLLGIFESVIIYLASIEYRELVAYSTLILLILFRPSGLFGRVR